MLFDEPLLQQIGRKADGVARNAESRAGAKRRPYLPHRSVKAQTRQVTRSIFVREAKIFQMPVDEMGKVCVRNLHALRISRGTGCVNDICEIARLNRVERRRAHPERRATHRREYRSRESHSGDGRAKASRQPRPLRQNFGEQSDSRASGQEVSSGT